VNNWDAYSRLDLVGLLSHNSGHEGTNPKAASIHASGFGASYNCVWVGRWLRRCRAYSKAAVAALFLTAIPTGASETSSGFVPGFVNEHSPTRQLHPELVGFLPKELHRAANELSDARLMWNAEGVLIVDFGMCKDRMSLGRQLGCERRAPLESVVSTDHRSALTGPKALRTSFAGKVWRRQRAPTGERSKMQMGRENAELKRGGLSAVFDSENAIRIQPVGSIYDLGVKREYIRPRLGAAAFFLPLTESDQQIGDVAEPDGGCRSKRCANVVKKADYVPKPDVDDVVGEAGAVIFVFVILTYLCVNRREE
jgi:hypothetical protein